MKKNKRKSIIILTLIAMILQMCMPILQNVSYAAIDTNENDWDISKEQNASIIATLDYDTGILRISGNGTIKDYLENDEDLPWNNIKEKITSVEIENGVQSIGENIFNGCRNLSSVTIPEGIISVGKYAFKDCNNLANLTMPQSVTSIGEGVFKNCSSLLNITIPNGVKTIENSTFEYCSKLNDITIPEGAIKIGDNAFRDCTNITNIIISNTVTEIGNMAFASCSSLTNIILPDGLTNIGESAFKNSGITSITIPSKVTNVGDMAFAKCTELSEIKVAEGNMSFTGVDGVLYTFDKTQLIKYPAVKQGSEYKVQDETVIISAYAFDSCKNLAQIVIPEGVTTIEHHSFDGCSNLANIEMPKSLKEIKDFAFSSCNGLTKVIIPNGVKNIGKQAFFTCNNLAEIVIPTSVVEIGEDIVNNNTNIISKNGSKVEKYAKENNKKYIVDANGPIITFTENKAEGTIWKKTITVNAADEFVGIDEKSLKYTWSKKSDNVKLEEITTSFANGETIQKNTETGIYYLWVAAYDLLGNVTIQNSSKIILDHTLPTITLNQSATDKTNMTITVAEMGSGLSSNNDYQYYISTSDTELKRGEWKNYTSGKIFNVEKGYTEIYYIFVKTISDNASNISTISGEMVTIGEETYHRFGPFTREKAKITFSPNGNEKAEQSVTIRVGGLGKNLQEYYAYAWIENTVDLNVGDSSATLNYYNFEEYDYSHGIAKNVGTENGKYNLVILDKTQGKIVAKSEVFSFGEEVEEKYFEINEYKTEDKYIKEILSETTIEEFKNNISTNMNYIIKENGQEIIEGIIKTGQTIEVENGEVYTVVVLGDLDGDGKVKLTDTILANQCRLNKKNLEGAYFLAADIVSDGVIDLKDILKINEYKTNNN